DKSVVLMKREKDGAACYIAVNFAKTEGTVTVPATGLKIVSDLEVADGKAALTKVDGATTVTLPPYAIVVIE
nr:hypothetical protein [Clostridia bacterium]